ncbi:Uncharacterized protein C57A7.05 [Hypsizygus marmoreus]|uniref:Uncharacterized protein C57A7.05 n=1 Tax=Hypsizygus marmoreus TaxID=39966 RepID=A0A369KD63_HYPMA|nr:Uncharacterized protein C57A7.05 [Hypsizygus marmoreus]
MVSEKFRRRIWRRGRDTKPEEENEEALDDEDAQGSPLGSLEDGDPKGVVKRSRWKLPESLGWIPANWQWTKLKPALRCAIAAWLGAVLFVIPAVETVLGQAAFLILIASVLSPPSDPFIAVLEREVLIMVCVLIGWAWSCLGMKLADLTREFHDPTVTLNQAITGEYIETAPTVIMAVFLGTGTAAFLYIKARQGPGPYIFPCVFGCICLDISLTTAVLFPYPFYLIGKTIVLPLVFHSAVALICSALVFPVTISAQFTTRLQGVLSPLIKTMELHQSILKETPQTEDFVAAAAVIAKTASQAESSLIPLAASARLLNSDLIYGRYAPGDFTPFQDLGRRIVNRGNGLGMYFTLIDPARLKFAVPMTPAPSRPDSPLPSPTSTGSSSQQNSRTPSADHIHFSDSRDGSSHEGKTSHLHPTLPAHWNSRPRQHQAHTHRHFHLHHDLLQRSLQSLAHSHKYENAVGVFESQRYLDLEATRFRDPSVEVFTSQMVKLLDDSCHELLGSCRDALVTVRDWLDCLRSGRLRYLLKTTETKAQWTKKLADHHNVRDELIAVFERFRSDDRHRVLDPYRSTFEAKVDSEQETPAHRYLFQAYVYQYHLIQFTWIVIEMLDEMIRLEKGRQTQRIWTPVRSIIRWNIWEIPEDAEHEEDEDPDQIQGLDPTTAEDLGLPKRRDPDALPPRNMFEAVMNLLFHAVTGLAGGNVLFAIKAGLLAVVLALPSFLKSSAFFAYSNRAVWAIIMGQVTLSRFRGDTTFSFIFRVFSTFMGGLVGMVIWYISCGSGNGNAYGLAAVCAVCFPFLFYARLYLPGSPITVIVFVVTIVLVVGYSYQDIHFPTPGSPGAGFSVAWRRFVLVTIGVAAAFVVSFLPPSSSIRHYSRATLATTSAEIGSIYCAILSYANSRRGEDVHEINAGLIALRSKLRRSAVVRTNVIYEFSLRGRWPAERYHALFEIELQIAYALSHLMSVFKHLEPAWARALLRRTRFLDTDFQGDILAVITMISSSLRTGSPLPQISPCPLLDRFMSQIYGLDVIHKEAEEDYGLPRTLTLETLQNEQYLFFCVGVSTSFSIITRLDRLMVAAKEIVGEQYHIHGVGLAPTLSKEQDYSMPTPAVQFRPPQEV